MTREELIRHLEKIPPAFRSGLNEECLASLVDARAEIAALTARAEQAERELAPLESTLRFNRDAHERELVDIRSRWADSDKRLRAHIDRTHRIGQRVLSAKFAGRKTIRIADLTDPKETS